MAVEPVELIHSVSGRLRRANPIVVDKLLGEGWVLNDGSNEPVVREDTSEMSEDDFLRLSEED